MDCQRVKQLSLTYIHGKLPLAQELELRNHTVTCDSCQAYLECVVSEERALRAAFQSSPPSYLRTKRILAAVHAVAAPFGQAQPISLGRILRPAYTCVGFALLAALVILAVLHETSPPAESAEPPTYYRSSSQEALELRMALLSPTADAQRAANLTGAYAEIYDIASVHAAAPPPEQTAPAASSPQESSPRNVSPSPRPQGPQSSRGVLSWPMA